MSDDWTLVRDTHELPNLLTELGDFQAFESSTNIFSYASGVVQSHSDAKIMVDALTRSGLTDYLSEFFPASYDSDLARFELKYDSMQYPNYGRFLDKIIGNKLIVPDTSVLIDRVIMRRLLGFLGNEKAKQVRLSRVSILELEALYQKDNGQPKSRSGFCEVRLLSGLGAKFLESLPWNLIIEYSEMLRSGKKSIRLGGDPAIRKEILEHVQDQRDRMPVSGKIVGDKIPANIILITSDFAFALASFGEGISSLYLMKKKFTERNTNYVQLALLVNEYAINAKSNLVLKGESSEIEVQGFWPMKTFYDLLEGRLHVRVRRF